MPLAVYVQDLNPLGHRGLSTLVAAVPVLVLFYLLVGRRWLASWAGAAGAATAVLVAWLVYHEANDAWSILGALLILAANTLNLAKARRR